MPRRAHKAGDTKANRKDRQTYVWIPPGTFIMGCSPGDQDGCENEKPAHEVEITRGFWMARMPITVEAYKRFAHATKTPMPGDTSVNPGWENDKIPMTKVTWEEAAAYSAWAGMRLPTEAEWEYAARAGTTGSRYGNLDDIAWYWDKVEEPQSPGRKQPNAFGLYDMLGNVSEWTADWYAVKYYETSERQDPKGPPTGEQRVLRAGSWYTVNWVVRASNRIGVRPDSSGLDAGFRCAGD